MTIDVLDTIHDPGKIGGANDDNLGHSGDYAWVFDGATGLVEEQLTRTASDAAWLSQAGTDALQARAPSHRGPLAGLVDEVIDDVSRRFEAEGHRQPQERYERPTASLILVRQVGGVLECLNFGDCKILLRDGTGTFQTFGSSEESEAYENHLATRFSEQRKEQGETGEPNQHRSSILERLRKVRNRHTVSGGYWVFALDAGAALHFSVWVTARSGEKQWLCFHFLMKNGLLRMLGTNAKILVLLEPRPDYDCQSCPNLLSGHATSTTEDPPTCMSKYTESMHNGTHVQNLPS